MEEDLRVCKICKVSKPLSNFGKSKRKEKVWYGHQCKSCRNKEYMDIYYQNHDERKKLLRQKVRKLYYGMIEEDFQQVLANQNYQCAICKIDSPGGHGNWHVDHCHNTGKIRGLLCHCCNTGLGLFKDNEDILLKARDYLHECK